MPSILFLFSSSSGFLPRAAPAARAPLVAASSRAFFLVVSGDTSPQYTTCLAPTCPFFLVLPGILPTTPCATKYPPFLPSPRRRQSQLSRLARRPPFAEAAAVERPSLLVLGLLQNAHSTTIAAPATITPTHPKHQSDKWAALARDPESILLPTLSPPPPLPRAPISPSLGPARRSTGPLGPTPERPRAQGI